MHGGKSLVGIASPSFRTGRYSRCMPARLAERYEEFELDPEHLSSKSEIALMTTRIEDLLTKVDLGESGETWKALRDAYRGCEKFRVAVNKGDPNALSAFWAAYDGIGALIGEGYQDAQAWSEIRDTVDARRKLTEAEVKRQTAGQNSVTVAQASTFAAALVASVKRHVTDRTILAAISADISRLVAVDGDSEAA